jgi:hypothetical protein
MRENNDSVFYELQAHIKYVKRLTCIIYPIVICRKGNYLIKETQRLIFYPP